MRYTTGSVVPSDSDSHGAPSDSHDADEEMHALGATARQSGSFGPATGIDWHSLARPGHANKALNTITQHVYARVVRQHPDVEAHGTLAEDRVPSEESETFTALVSGTDLR